jgi:hypothetical protein
VESERGDVIMTARASGLVCAVAGAALGLAGAVAPAGAAVWTWTNEHQSILSVDSVTADGLLTGTFTNKAPKSCDINSPQPMTGWIGYGSTGIAISFTVIFKGCDSITTWSGQVDPQTGNFTALWLLSLEMPIAWNGITANTDTFTLTSGAKPALKQK